MVCLVVGISHICLKWTPSKKWSIASVIFFVSKAQTICDGLDRLAATSGYVVENLQTAPLKYHLTSFDDASENEIHRVIMRSPSKTCGLDPIPTQIPKENIESLASTITRIVNLSMSTGTIPSSFKQALVNPLLKKTFIGPQHIKKLQIGIKPGFCVEGSWNAWF